MAKVQGIIGCPRMTIPKPIVHASGARTDCISNCDMLVSLEDTSPPQAYLHEDKILVLSELNHCLVWRDYNGRYFHGQSDSTDEPLQMPNGHRLYIRPGAESLVASLLKHPDCSLVITSGMGHWHCLPFVRLLLQSAVPGEWVVDDVLEGQWFCFGAGGTHTIEGATLTSRDWSPPDAQDPSSASRTFELSVGSERSVSYEKEGVTYHGELTPDGFLEWCWEKGNSEIWGRAGRSRPPSFVLKSQGSCPETQQQQQQQQRVYVFDREHFVETVSEVGESNRFRKELDRIWCALRESNFGSFGESNTVLLDPSTDDISHPANVVPVPRWNTNMPGNDMSALQDYIHRLVVAQPANVADWLHAHPFGGA